MARIEVQFGPVASSEGAITERAGLELRRTESAVHEGASADRDPLHVALAEGATAELACGPDGVLKSGRCEAAAAEGARRESDQVEVEAGVGIAVALAGKTCRRTAGAFSPLVVILDDLFSAHDDSKFFPRTRNAVRRDAAPSAATRAIRCLRFMPAPKVVMRSPPPAPDDSSSHEPRPRSPIHWHCPATAR
ncbi:hypothetical protein D3C87_1419330 [compost metagenome]